MLTPYIRINSVFRKVDFDNNKLLCENTLVMKLHTRKIPATMATQHPDNARKPYWHNDSFIPAIEETKELFLSLADLGASEYMWDWEGKLVDESVLERLLAKQFEYFKKNPIGKNKFLTFRLPNLTVETEFRLGRALMGILSAAGLCKQVGLHTPPLFEVILPMTESASQMLEVQKAFSEIASLKHPLNKFEKDSLKHIEIIPLFEQVGTIIRCGKILEEYFEMHIKTFGFLPKTLRPFLARSDPALNSGLIPTVTAAKIALSDFKNLEKKYHIKLYPIIGVGSLPFRGGLYPLNPERFISEYQGIRTVTVQSAFRYDYPKQRVINAIKTLERELPKGKTKEISDKEKQELVLAIQPFEKAYQSSISGIAPIINLLAAHMPKRRERVQHIGLFGYSRGMGKVRLPRAITFTAALYSLGVPPELIGTGRGLAAAKKAGHLHLLEKYYVNMAHDLYFAGKFLYRPGLINLAKKSKAWKDILTDVEEIEKYLGKPLAPKYLNEQEHQLLSARLHKNLHSGKNITSLIEQSAQLRKSLG